MNLAIDPAGIDEALIGPLGLTVFVLKIKRKRDLTSRNIRTTRDFRARLTISISGDVDDTKIGIPSASYVGVPVDCLHMRVAVFSQRPVKHAL